MILYAIFIGVYNIFKKKATIHSNESVILVLFTFTSFLLSFIWIPFGIIIEIKIIGLLAIKGFLLAFSWFCILKVLKEADITIVSITTAISSVLTFSIGIWSFNEKVTIIQLIGAILIVSGSIFINLVSKQTSSKTNIKHLTMLLLSAIITSISSVIDKFTTSHAEFHQVQFWFLLFVFLSSILFFTIDCLKHKKSLISKNDFKNYWIYFIGLFLFLGDMFLFLSYKCPGSQMSIISVLAKFKIIVTVLLGMIIFKEKNITKKLLISVIVLAGVILVSI